MITSSMVTTTPYDLVKETHPVRMPAILAPEDYEVWLNGSPKEALGVIKPYPADRMVVHQSGVGLKSDHGGV